jgi:hypothetical protein
MLAIHHPLFEETERGTVITQQQSERLARDWVEAWNRHDLDGIMAHYTDDVAFTSPFVAALANEPGDASWHGSGTCLFFSRLGHVSQLAIQIGGHVTGVTSGRPERDGGWLDCAGGGPLS